MARAREQDPVALAGLSSQSRTDDGPKKGEPPAGGQRRWYGGLWAMVRQRCPRCRKGQMFRGPFTMNDPCPVCGLLFQREEGYFLGAMYVSYLLGCVILIPFYFIAAFLFPNWSGMALAVAALVVYLPFSPAVFRYSRVVWVHLDRAIDPSTINAGAYEKDRLRQLEQAKVDTPRKEDGGHAD